MAKQLESQEQYKVIQWRDANKIRFPKLKRLFHVPNGGFRSGRTGIDMKRLGVIRGVPDLILLTPSPGIIRVPDFKNKGKIGFNLLEERFNFFCGEMKAPGGKLSPEQIIFRDQVIEDGGYYVVSDKAHIMVEHIMMYLLIGVRELQLNSEQELSGKKA